MIQRGEKRTRDEFFWGCVWWKDFNTLYYQAGALLPMWNSPPDRSLNQVHLSATVKVWITSARRCLVNIQDWMRVSRAKTLAACIMLTRDRDEAFCFGISEIRRVVSGHQDNNAAPGNIAVISHKQKLLSYSVVPQVRYSYTADWLEEMKMKSVTIPKLISGG